MVLLPVFMTTCDELSFENGNNEADKWNLHICSTDE